ncbi:MAG TPA: GNAT family N-acetyltransferase [Phenylobacterium sp.]|uniref:GNAT family N-acetyltransferase n=1 Tax=Phenylobacterium sp. TaxID=1871053 RepID=UPI002B4680EE|nr:GNAT family N-acetyltransferase [Phenylobacterium sp.]HKR90113.1 GNAT family N-acetyltransferase [Phenylobacterium sp.]
MDIDIRPLRQQDLPQADRIFRLAFGTFLGLPDPLAFAGDADLVTTRWRARPDAALGAYVDDQLVGSNFAADWGGFGYFGPLTVRPDLWDRGVARRLLAATMELFESWRTPQLGLFTFPHSPKHLGLYGKYGFHKHDLTPVMSKPVQAQTSGAAWSAYSALAPEARAASLSACRALADAVSSGLDLSGEIRAVAELGLGDTVLVHDGADLAGFAVCHVGAGSEAGSGALYVKFGAARPGGDAARNFDRLLSACEAFAHTRGAEKMVAGVNAARKDACRAMTERGFSTVQEGVAMQRPNQPGHNRPDCFVIDDWR